MRNCCMCGEPLKRFYGKSRYWKYAPHVELWGFCGNQFFCTMRCAAWWAVLKADAGDD